MQTDEISHLLSRDPLMCRTYDVVAKYSLPEIIVDTYPAAIVCNTHDTIDRENTGSPCTWTPSGAATTSIRTDCSRSTSDSSTL